jgi:photosystem II stability/assembly factor-like uncharacterized protein
MRLKVAILCVALTAAVGCKKSNSPTGGGGGGGGWLVGSDALMKNITPDGDIAQTYQLGTSDTLNGIACRYAGEAWVVGSTGTLLYTNDGGKSWSVQSVPTQADLRTLATQDFGPVFVAGDGVFLTSSDTGAHWASFGDGVTSFRSMAAAQEGSTVLAVSDKGALWSYENNQLVHRADYPGMRGVAVSPDGATVILVGSGILRSTDGGQHFSSLAVDSSIAFEDVRIGDAGNAVAVGANGAIASIAVGGAVTVQTVGTATLHTLHIADLDSEDAVGYAAGEGGQVLITHDGGLHWAFGPNVGATVLGVDEIGDGHR